MKILFSGIIFNQTLTLLILRSVCFLLLKIFRKTHSSLIQRRENFCEENLGLEKPARTFPFNISFQGEEEAHFSNFPLLLVVKILAGHVVILLKVTEGTFHKYLRKVENYSEKLEKLRRRGKKR